MRIVQKPGHPMSIYLVAEDEREAVLVAALREHSSSLQVHRLFSDEGYEEFVREPAQNELDAEHVALEVLGERPDQYEQLCRRHRGRGRLHRRECPECRYEVEAALVERAVELEIRVPCACWPDCERGPSFDKETGHIKRCLVPRAKALGMEVEDGRAENPLPQVRGRG